MLTVSHLFKNYPTDRGPVQAVKLTLSRDQFVAVRDQPARIALGAV